MVKMKIYGIITPIITPMKTDESLNEEELRRQVERLIDSGIHGIFPLGTNGEGFCLREMEKERILEVVVEQVKGRVPVFAGTGCISTQDTIRLSKIALKKGVDALSVITPYFAKASQEELYKHYMDVAFAVPDIPIILYNIPMRTGNMLLPETVARLAKDAPNIVGVKDSSGDFNNILAYYNQTRNISDKEFCVLSGNDSLILPTLMAGGAGGVAGCSNVYPKVLASIYELFIQGKLDECRAAQESIASFRECFKYGNPNTIVKIAVRLLGYDVGECRKPFTGVSAEGMNKIKQVLEENKKRGMS
jgi:4-hydroxy-tetrahydrodipicolinate synthase